MKLLHSISDNRCSSNVNTLAEILACPDELSMDGPYESVYAHRFELMHRKPILFILEDYVGKDNSFDAGKHFLEKFCTWEQIFEMGRMGFRLGHHSRTHRDLTTLSDLQIEEEVLMPFPMKYFAYPGGRTNNRVASIVEGMGYESAWAAGPHGDGSQFQQKRSYLNW